VAAIGLDQSQQLVKGRVGKDRGHLHAGIPGPVRADQSGDAAQLGRGGERLGRGEGFGRAGVAVEAGQHGRVGFDALPSGRRAAKDHDRHAEVGGLLLNAARVGHDDLDPTQLAQQLVVRNGSRQNDPVLLQFGVEAGRLQPGRSAGMDREPDRADRRRQLLDQPNQAAQALRVVDVGRTVGGDEDAATLVNRHRAEAPTGEGVDHGIADDEDPAELDAFGEQERTTLLGRRQME
jgi:hypothetical protein